VTSPNVCSKISPVLGLLRLPFISYVMCNYQRSCSWSLEL
jgi:hypothetical protein